MAANVAPQCVDDIFIMLIDNDTTSVASLTSMLENLSKRGKEKQLILAN